MTVRGTLHLHLSSPEEALRAREALRPDDDAYVKTEAVDAQLRVVVQAPDLPAFTRAMDDVLAQVSVFEDLIRDGRGAPPRA